MISKFRPTASKKQKKNLKGDLLKEVKQSLSNGDEYVQMLVEAKSLQVKYSQIPEAQVREDEVNPTKNSEQQEIQQIPQLEPQLTFQPSIGYDMPQIVFVEPPLELKKRRQLQVKFEEKNNQEQEDYKQQNKLLIQDIAKLQSALSQIKDNYIEIQSILQLEIQQNIQNKNIISDHQSEKSKNEKIMTNQTDAAQDQKNIIESLEGEKNNLQEKIVLLTNQIENFKEYESDKNQTKQILQTNLSNQQVQLESQFQTIIQLKQQVNQQQIISDLLVREKDKLQIIIDQMTVTAQRQSQELDKFKIIHQKLFDENARLNIYLKENNKLIDVKDQQQPSKQKQPDQQPIKLFQEMTEARNETVQLTKKLFENEEQLRQMKIRNEVLCQREPIHNDLYQANTRLQGELELIEAQCENLKKKNRKDIEESCLQRDINQHKENLLSVLEDELNLKQFNILQEIKNVDYYKNTIEELNKIIKNREKIISDLTIVKQNEMAKVEEQLNIAKNRLQMEQMKSQPLPNKNLVSPFTIPQLNQKFQRQYL